MASIGFGIATPIQGRSIAPEHAGNAANSNGFVQVSGTHIVGSGVYVSARHLRGSAGAAAATSQAVFANTADSSAQGRFLNISA
jgi:hypothetical protein